MPEIGKWETTAQLTVLTGDITTANNQSLKLVPDGTGIVQIGDAGTTSHGLNANDDLYVSGRFEVDEPAYFDNETLFITLGRFYDNAPCIFGAGSEAMLEWNIHQTNDALMICTALGTAEQSGNVILCEAADRSVDFGHPVASNPTFYIQSADATSPSEHLKFYHDQTDGHIECGSGDFYLSSSAGNVYLSASTGRVMAYRSGVQSFVEAFDSTGVDYTRITHDGTWGSIRTNAGPLQVRGVGGVDLQETQGVGMRIPTAPPTSLAAGSMYFDPATNNLYCHNGTAWVSVTLT